MTESSQASAGSALGSLADVPARAFRTVVTLVIWIFFALVLEVTWLIGGWGFMQQEDRDRGLVPFVPALIAALTLTLTITISIRRSAKRSGSRYRPWYTIVALVGVGVCFRLGYGGYHEDDLTMRSRAVEEQVRLALPNKGDTAPLTLLLPAETVKDDPPSFVCTVTPYESVRDIPELAHLDFGIDGAWLDPSGNEGAIGVVALDARGGIVSVVRLSRFKVDLYSATAYGRCYRPAEAKLVQMGMREDTAEQNPAVLLEIQSKPGAP